jgi:hypothetical protein
MESCLITCAHALAPVIEPFIELSGGRFVAGHSDPLRDYVPYGGWLRGQGLLRGDYV